MLDEWLLRAVTAAVGCIAFTTAVYAEEKFQRLNEKQIRATFVGMELTDESHWGDIFEPNGTLRTSSMGHKTTGKWRIQKDRLCLDRGRSRAVDVTKCGYRERKWSSEIRPRVTLWRAC